MAVGATYHCLKIRNQYAHCNWYDDSSGKLTYIKSRGRRKRNAHTSEISDLKISPSRHDVPGAGEAYLVFTNDLINWVKFEGQKWAGKIASHAHAKPKHPVHTR